MLRFIMNRNLLLYVLAAACAVGVISQIILKQLYARLMKDTRNTGEPVSSFLQQLRQRFQYCTHLNGKVGNVQALIQRSVLEYRFWKLSLHQWKRLGTQCLAVSLLCSFAGTAVIVREGGSILTGSVYLWMGILAVVLTAAAYGIADTAYAEDCLEIRLTDYLENSGAVRDYSAEGGVFDTGSGGREGVKPGRGSAASSAIVPVDRGRKSKRKARAELAEQTRAQKEKRELKESLAKVKAGMQEAAAEREHETDKERGAEILRQMDEKEQERIVREVLKEFLS